VGRPAFSGVLGHLLVAARNLEHRGRLVRKQVLRADLAELGVDLVALRVHFSPKDEGQLVVFQPTDRYEPVDRVPLSRL
jgi:hypothetical protein